MNAVSYLRVSTERQGRSGLGVEAQRAAVAKVLDARGLTLLSEHVDTESGGKDDRPALKAALDQCRATGAVLIVAKLDRLSRNARFLLQLVEESGEGGVVFADLPDLPSGAAGKFVLTMLAAVAELERGMISDRTKAALAAAKARGVKLGNPNLPEASEETAARARTYRIAYANERAETVWPYIEQARAAGCRTDHEIAEALTNRGVRTPGGARRWSATQVSRVRSRLRNVRRRENGHD